MDQKLVPDLVIKLPSAKELAKEIGLALQPSAELIQEAVQAAWWGGFATGALAALVVCTFLFVLVIAGRKR